LGNAPEIGIESILIFHGLAQEIVVGIHEHGLAVDPPGRLGQGGISAKNEETAKQLSHHSMIYSELA
jgi:hypothetical protein